MYAKPKLNHKFDHNIITFKGDNHKIGQLKAFFHMDQNLTILDHILFKRDDICIVPVT